MLHEHTQTRRSLQHALVEHKSVTLRCTLHVSTYVRQRGCSPVSGRHHSFSLKLDERQFSSRDEGGTAAAAGDLDGE